MMDYNGYVLSIYVGVGMPHGCTCKWSYASWSWGLIQLLKDERPFLLACRKRLRQFTMHLYPTVVPVVLPTSDWISIQKRYGVNTPSSHENERFRPTSTDIAMMLKSNFVSYAQGVAHFWDCMRGWPNFDCQWYISGTLFNKCICTWH